MAIVEINIVPLGTSTPSVGRAHLLVGGGSDTTAQIW